MWPVAQKLQVRNTFCIFTTHLCSTALRTFKENKIQLQKFRDNLKNKALSEFQTSAAFV